MGIIDELVRSVFGGLVDLFLHLLTGLFNALKPLFIVAIAVVVIYLVRVLYKLIKKRRDEQKYIDGMKAKYANRPKSELVEIYDFLTRLEECENKMGKKRGYERNRDEVRWGAAWALMEEMLSDRYPFIVDNYRHHDIAYLKKLI